MTDISISSEKNISFTASNNSSHSQKNPLAAKRLNLVKRVLSVFLFICLVVLELITFFKTRSEIKEESDRYSKQQALVHGNMLVNLTSIYMDHTMYATRFIYNVFDESKNWYMGEMDRDQIYEFLMIVRSNFEFEPKKFTIIRNGKLNRMMWETSDDNVITYTETVAKNNQTYTCTWNNITVVNGSINTTRDADECLLSTYNISQLLTMYGHQLGGLSMWTMRQMNKSRPSINYALVSTDTGTVITTSLYLDLLLRKLRKATMYLDAHFALIWNETLTLTNTDGILNLDAIYSFPPLYQFKFWSTLFNETSDELWYEGEHYYTYSKQLADQFYIVLAIPGTTRLKKFLVWNSVFVVVINCIIALAYYTIKFVTIFLKKREIETIDEYESKITEFVETLPVVGSGPVFNSIIKLRSLELFYSDDTSLNKSADSAVACLCVGKDKLFSAKLTSQCPFCKTLCSGHAKMNISNEKVYKSWSTTIPATLRDFRFDRPFEYDKFDKNPKKYLINELMTLICKKELFTVDMNPDTLLEYFMYLIYHNDIDYTYVGFVIYKVKNIVIERIGNFLYPTELIFVLITIIIRLITFSNEIRTEEEMNDVLILFRKFFPVHEPPNEHDIEIDMYFLDLLKWTSSSYMNKVLGEITIKSFEPVLQNKATNIDRHLFVQSVVHFANYIVYASSESEMKWLIPRMISMTFTKEEQEDKIFVNEYFKFFAGVLAKRWFVSMSTFVPLNKHITSLNENIERFNKMEY